MGELRERLLSYIHASDEDGEASVGITHRQSRDEKGDGGREGMKTRQVGKRNAWTMSTLI